MKKLSKQEKIGLLLENLPVSVRQYAKDKGLVVSTVYSKIKRYDTGDPVLQDLIRLAHKNAFKKKAERVKADKNIEEIQKAKD